MAAFATLRVALTAALISSSFCFTQATATALSMTQFVQIATGNDGENAFIGSFVPFNPTLGHLSSIDVDLNLNILLGIQARNTTSNIIDGFVLHGTVEVELLLGSADLDFPARSIDEVFGAPIRNWAPSTDERLLGDVSYEKIAHIDHPDLSFTVPDPLLFLALGPTNARDPTYGITIFTFGAIEDSILQITYNYDTDVSAVPEISSWLMAIFGFCGIGLVASRRKFAAA